MPATVTLSTTQLFEGITDQASEIKVLSASGIAVGSRLWVDKELMAVTGVGVTGSGYTYLKVRRGDGGSPASPHSSGALVTIGTADQFYSYDPVGAPPVCTTVAPWINVKNGNVWYAQGDAAPEGQTSRWWQNVSTTYGQGALGVRTVSTDPTAST